MKLLLLVLLVVLVVLLNVYCIIAHGQSGTGKLHKQIGWAFYRYEEQVSMTR